MHALRHALHGEWGICVEAAVSDLCVVMVLWVFFPQRNRRRWGTLRTVGVLRTTHTARDWCVDVDEAIAMNEVEPTADGNPVVAVHEGIVKNHPVAHDVVEVSVSSMTHSIMTHSIMTHSITTHKR